MAEAKRRAQYL